MLRKKKVSCRMQHKLQGIKLDFNKKDDLIMIVASLDHDICSLTNQMFGVAKILYLETEDRRLDIIY